MRRSHSKFTRAQRRGLLCFAMLRSSSRAVVYWSRPSSVNGTLAAASARAVARRASPTPDSAAGWPMQVTPALRRAGATISEISGGVPADAHERGQRAGALLEPDVLVEGSQERRG